ncbi:hypothetical protein SAY87_000167 [Trapa incisa]|uniref:Uncharacterized protein n=1 Tax=Trapa incisa TaxID=236973 RepID=A0AAN7GBN5_9MYRT|nr:hypothetical protein SAY87_000167 [Trapa incisa]
MDRCQPKLIPEWLKTNGNANKCGSGNHRLAFCLHSDKPYLLCHGFCQMIILLQSMPGISLPLSIVTMGDHLFMKEVLPRILGGLLVVGILPAGGSLAVSVEVSNTGNEMHARL